jgi:hypothetical protein
MLRREASECAVELVAIVDIGLATWSPMSTGVHVEPDDACAAATSPSR